LFWTNIVLSFGVESWCTSGRFQYSLLVGIAIEQALFKKHKGQLSSANRNAGTDVPAKLLGELISQIKPPR
jgi:hypothetical protein